MADIVLIHPRFEISYWGLEHAMPFLGLKAIMPVASLPLLAALTPPSHTVTIIDENIEPIDFARCAQADIVGVTGMNVQRHRMKEILGELRGRGVFTVVGGAWVTVQEDDITGLADVIFVGEAETTWPQFLSEWGEGRHRTRYEQAERTDMTTVPPPRLDLLRMHHYALGSLQFSRGCPFTCEFCDIIVTFGRRPRLKTSAQIVAELDGIVAAGKTSAFIVDDNLIGNKAGVKKLLKDVHAWQEKHGYPLMFATEASIDLAEDAELMQLMVDANITEVFIGIESPNEESLRETKKLQNLRGRGGTMLDKVHRIQEAGIEVWCGIIVGFDNDDPGIFTAQRRFLAESRIASVMVNMLVAIPRTPLYKRLRAEGRLDLAVDQASAGAFGTNVVPLRIGRAELRQGYIELMRDLYAPQAYFARLDQLYLDARLRVAETRKRYLRRHPLRRLTLNTRFLFEAVGITLMLHRVPDPELRREYRRRILRIAWRRRSPQMVELYAIKCAMHYHAHRMVREMLPGETIPGAAASAA